MGGREANTRPEREIRPPTRCGFQRLPAPCWKQGLKSLNEEQSHVGIRSRYVRTVDLFFEEKTPRGIVIYGEPWFVAADVCAALEISNPSMALRVLDDDEKALSLIEGLSKLVGGNEQV